MEMWGAYKNSDWPLCSKWWKMLQNYYKGKAFLTAGGTRIMPEDCVVYSIGINKELEFDFFSESFGCEVCGGKLVIYARNSQSSSNKYLARNIIIRVW